MHLALSGLSNFRRPVLQDLPTLVPELRDQPVPCRLRWGRTERSQGAPRDASQPEPAGWHPEVGTAPKQWPVSPGWATGGGGAGPGGLGGHRPWRRIYPDAKRLCVPPPASEQGAPGGPAGLMLHGVGGHPTRQTWDLWDQGSSPRLATYQRPQLMLRRELSVGLSGGGARAAVINLSGGWCSEAGAHAARLPLGWAAPKLWGGMNTAPWRPAAGHQGHPALCGQEGLWAAPAHLGTAHWPPPPPPAGSLAPHPMHWFVPVF